MCHSANGLSADLVTIRSSHDKSDVVIDHFGSVVEKVLIPLEAIPGNDLSLLDVFTFDD